jgi:hypothetical protein
MSATGKALLANVAMRAMVGDARPSARVKSFAYLVAWRFERSGLSETECVRLINLGYLSPAAAEAAGQLKPRSVRTKR